MQPIHGNFGERDEREIPGMLVAFLVTHPGFCIFAIVRFVI
jgi:hypothetical protein